MSQDIVSIELGLPQGDVVTLWAPRWREDGEEWEAFLGHEDDLYAFPDAAHLAAFVRTVDEHDLALAVTGPFAWEVDPYERVSVYPLTPVTFAASEGLMFKLDGLTLAIGHRVGMWNAASEGPFSIMPEPESTSPWLLIVRRHYLMALIDRLLEEPLRGGLRS